MRLMRAERVLLVRSTNGRKGKSNMTAEVKTEVWLTTRFLFQTEEWEVSEVWMHAGCPIAKRLAGPFATELEAREALQRLATER